MWLAGDSPGSKVTGVSSVRRGFRTEGGTRRIADKRLTSYALRSWIREPAEIPAEELIGDRENIGGRGTKPEEKGDRSQMRR